VEAIALAAREFSVDIIGTSALLTSSLKEQKKLEKYLREIGERDRYITMVGGAPVTQRWAEKIGADGYSDTAREAVEKALELLNKKKGGNH
jgi:trimethylamine corrinoid protein